MISKLFGRITGADKKKTTPMQQTSILGRIGEHIIVFPYGLYADLPNNILIKELIEGWAIPVTQDRPSDGGNGEPIFFHPSTNTRIIPRNDGSLFIETGEGGTAPVNINCTEAIINGNVSVTGDLNVDGEITADASGAGVTLTGHTHSQPSDSAGNSQSETNSPTSGT